MKFRKSMIAVMCAASLGAVSVPLAASAAVEIYFNSPPPAPRYEVVPAARAGYIWSPGYWKRANNRHEWQAGHWERRAQGLPPHASPVGRQATIAGSSSRGAGIRIATMTASPIPSIARRTIPIGTE
jgi:hypothetical protein